MLQIVYMEPTELPPPTHLDDEPPELDAPEDLDLLGEMLRTAEAAYATAPPLRVVIEDGCLRLFVREPVAACGFLLGGTASQVVAHYPSRVSAMSCEEIEDGAAIFDVPTDGLCAVHVEHSSFRCSRPPGQWLLWSGTELLESTKADVEQHRIAAQKAKFPPMPDLIGTPGQVAWANQIRDHLRVLRPTDPRLRNLKAAWWIQQRHQLVGR